jgi:hypothetical protein
MAFFRNLGVNLRDRLCDVPRYASAQSLDFLDLAKNCSFLNWKLAPVSMVQKSLVDGHYLVPIHKCRFPKASSLEEHCPVFIQKW